MLSAVLSLVVAAAPLSLELVERQPLAQKPRAVVVDALLGRVALPGVDAAALRALAKKSALCPRTEVVGARTVLVCNSRKLTARYDGAALVLRTLKGPVDGGARLATYAPEAHELGGPCPGTTPSGRGECAFARGDLVTAVLELKQAQKILGPAGAHAALRLGDIAWIAGDVEAAARAYDDAGTGPFARLAAARLCELLSCLEGPSERIPFDAFDSAGLDDVMKAELALRRARALTAVNKLDEAVHVLVAERVNAPCALAPAICRKVATAALLARSGRDASEALSLALTLKDAFDGEGAVDLAAAVVDHVERLGAPLFAANVLAATSSQVEPAAVDGWILRCAERYLDADDDARAHAVVAYADSRKFPLGKNARRWTAVKARLKALEQPPTPEVKS